MEQQPHILIVDDDQRIRTMLSRYLKQEGFRVSDAEDGAAMRRVLEREPVDLVLLDLVMPGEDGFTLARFIRQNATTPVIMVTGKDDVIDRVAGLEAGADDYVTKPFHLREVLARIRTILRRAHAAPAPAAPQAGSPQAAAETGEVLAFDEWRLDLARRELRRQSGDLVALTTGEFELLRVLAMNPNRALNRDQLMDLVKGREWSAYDRAIDAQIVRLRRKIERDPANPGLIKTVRGIGYIFAATVSRR